LPFKFKDKNMDNSNATTHGEELPQHLLEAIHRLIQAGAPHQAICSVLGLKLEDVQRVLAKAPSQDSKLTAPIREKSKKYRPVKDNRLMTSPAMASDNSIEQSSLEAHPAMSIEQVMLSPKKKTKICMESSTYNTKDIQTQLHADKLPTFIYSNYRGTNQLHWTSLVTGEQSTHRVPSYTFNGGCFLSEVPGGSLLITGGGHRGLGPSAVREVVRIDTRREFAVSHCSPMLTPRIDHAAVYHSPHLYVLGGSSGTRISRKCERYVFAGNRWEALPPLPRACRCPSGVVLESSLYALGGIGSIHLDLVQKLSLESLTWEIMQFRLPHTGNRIPCFKLRDTEVYLVVNKTLCSFTGFEVCPLRTLAESIRCWYGASYYRSGTLYCSNQWGAAVLSYEIGSLSTSL
jgi:hypothetical protein